MLTERILDALNKQLNREIYSAYLYLSMAGHSEHIGLKGFANWFKVQSQEEMTHAMKIYNYINEQGEKAKLMAIEQPPAEFNSPLQMFEQTLEHEKSITRNINELIDIATKEKDHATKIFLQWFVTEQVEEEANDNEIIAKLKLVGEEGSALYIIDKELGTRQLGLEAE